MSRFIVRLMCVYRLLGRFRSIIRRRQGALNSIIILYGFCYNLTRGFNKFFLNKWLLEVEQAVVTTQGAIMPLSTRGGGGLGACSPREIRYAISSILSFKKTQKRSVWGLMRCTLFSTLRLLLQEKSESGI